MTCARYAMTCAIYVMTSSIYATTSYCCSLCCHSYHNWKCHFTKCFWVTKKRHNFQYT